MQGLSHFEGVVEFWLVVGGSIEEGAALVHQGPSHNLLHLMTLLVDSNDLKCYRLTRWSIMMLGMSGLTQLDQLAHIRSHICLLHPPRPRTPLIGPVPATMKTPPYMAIRMKVSEIKHTQLTKWNILTPHMQGLTHFDQLMYIRSSCGFVLPGGHGQSPWQALTPHLGRSITMSSVVGLVLWVITLACLDHTLTSFGPHPPSLSYLLTL